MGSRIEKSFLPVFSFTGQGRAEIRAGLHIK